MNTIGIWWKDYAEHIQSSRYIPVERTSRQRSKIIIGRCSELMNIMVPKKPRSSTPRFISYLNHYKSSKWQEDRNISLFREPIMYTVYWSSHWGQIGRKVSRILLSMIRSHDLHKMIHKDMLSSCTTKYNIHSLLFWLRGIQIRFVYQMVSGLEKLCHRYESVRSRLGRALRVWEKVATALCRSTMHFIGKHQCPVGNQSVNQCMRSKTSHQIRYLFWSYYELAKDFANIKIKCMYYIMRQFWRIKCLLWLDMSSASWIVEYCLDGLCNTILIREENQMREHYVGNGVATLAADCHKVLYGHEENF